MVQVVFRAAEPPPAAFVYVPASPAAAGSGLLLGSGVPTSTSFVAVTASSASTTPLGAFVGATMAAYCAPSNPPPGAPPSYSARAYSASAAPSLVAVSASGDESPLPLVAAVRTPATDCPALWLSVSFTYDFSAAPAGTLAYCARAPPLIISACPVCLPGEEALPRYGVTPMTGAYPVEVCVPASRAAEGIAFSVDTRAERSSSSTILTPALRAVLAPTGGSGSVHPSRGGNVTLTSVPRIAVLVSVPSPPSTLNVLALVGAFVLSSVSAVGRLHSLALSAPVASRAKRIAAAPHTPRLLRASLAAFAVGLPCAVGVLILRSAAGDYGTAFIAAYFVCTALSSVAVLTRVAVACGAWTAHEAVARARLAITGACAAAAFAGLPAALAVTVRGTARGTGAPSGTGLLFALSDSVQLFSFPCVIAAALLVTMIHERNGARGKLTLSSNAGCASVGVLWLWGAVICGLACVSGMAWWQRV